MAQEGRRRRGSVRREGGGHGAGRVRREGGKAAAAGDAPLMPSSRNTLGRTQGMICRAARGGVSGGRAARSEVRSTPHGTRCRAVPSCPVLLTPQAPAHLPHHANGLVQGVGKELAKGAVTGDCLQGQGGGRCSNGDGGGLGQRSRSLRGAGRPRARQGGPPHPTLCPPCRAACQPIPQNTSGGPPREGCRQSAGGGG